MLYCVIITLLAAVATLPSTLANTEMEVDAVAKARSSRKLQLASAQGGVSISGLNKPISVTWDYSGNIYIAEKAGIVKRVRSWTGVPGKNSIILDISERTSSFGDHGLTSILWEDGWLYATYMKVNPLFGQQCNDHGQMDGRTRGEVEGCPIDGRVSRWPTNEQGLIAGPEQVLFDTQPGNKACAQFSTHSIPACIVKDPAPGATGFFVSLGDGAAFTTVDFGDLGDNPCDDTYPYIGAFRCQDPDRMAGKIIRIDPQDDWEPEIWSIGHRNPFRLTTVGLDLYESETGWYTYEEINHIQKGRNYGWPCFEGPVRTPEYDGYDDTPVGQICVQMEADGIHTLPIYAYEHPEIVAPMVTAISAVGAWNDRMYFGDYAAGWLASIDMSFDPTTVEYVARDTYPVELRTTPDNVLIVVDHRLGEIYNAQLENELASPSPMPIPTCTIVSTQDFFEPATGTVTFGSTSNIAGREGGTYRWVVVMLSQCGINGPNTCGFTWLFENSEGATLSFAAPYIDQAASLEITLEVNTNMGTTTGIPPAVATVQLPVNPYGGCECTGGRVEVAMPPLPDGVELDSGDGIIEGAPYRPATPPLTIPPPPGPIPMPGSAAVLPGTVEVQTYQANWSPNGPKLTFAAYAPWPENTPGIQYTWNIYANMYCQANTCSYEHIFGMGLNAYNSILPDEPGDRVITFDPPDLEYSEVPGGITLDISVVAYNPATQESATGVYYLPSAGRPVCRCSDVPALNRYLSTLTPLEGVSGIYAYNAASVETTYIIPELPDNFDPNDNPLEPSQFPDPGTTIKGKSTIDTSSPVFIGVVAAAGAVLLIAAAFLTYMIRRRSRTEPPKEGETTEAPPAPVVGDNPMVRKKKERRSRRPQGITLEGDATTASAPATNTPTNHSGPSPKGNRKV